MIDSPPAIGYFLPIMGILKTFKRGAKRLRELVLDTETTGLSPEGGDRLLEIGIVEMADKQITGREFHALVNPERDIPEEVSKIHGITADKVKNKPAFAAIARHLRDFIGNDPVIITCRTKDGMTLDIAMLNMEFEKAGVEKIPEEQFINVRRWSETMFGDKYASLDRVLDRYGISRR